MTVLFISNDPQLLDVSSRAYERMHRYADAIGDLTILMRHNSEAVVLPNGTLTVECVSGSKLAGLRALAKRAHEIISERGIEVVSCQDPFEHGLVGLRAVRGTSAKLHIQVHTDFLSPWFTRGGIFRSPQVTMPVKNALRVRIAHHVLPKANGIRVVSERIKASLIARYGSRISEPTVLPIAPQAALPPKVPFPFETLPFTLVTVGRLEPEKRIDDIIYALASLRDSHPSVGLVIIGEGRDGERLQKTVRDMGLDGRVVFLGARADAWGLIQSAQGYIQASAYEGYGITLIEAALSRVPIITSDVGIIGEVLKGYEDVLVSPPGDPTNLAYHIISLLEDIASREQRVRSAERKAEVHVSAYQNLPEHVARDLARLVEV